MKKGKTYQINKSLAYKIIEINEPKNELHYMRIGYAPTSDRWSLVNVYGTLHQTTITEFKARVNAN